VGRAHGRQGEGTPRPRSPEHTAETPSRLRQPTAGAVLAAAHGNEPGFAVNPVACPVSTYPFGLLRLTLRTRYPTQHSWPLRDRAPTPPPRRRRARAGADHAANAVALLCATRRASNPRGVHGLPGGVQAPGAVGPRRRQGRVPPPSPSGAFRRTPCDVLKNRRRP
jgi:hypothetical protein